MLCYEGKLSLFCFLGTFGLICVLLIPQVYFEIIPNDSTAVLFGPLFYFVIINMILRLGLKGNNYQIAIRASFLGFTTFVSLMIVLCAPQKWKSFGIYAAFMSFFHYSEFLAISWSNPQSLTVDSFILNHSMQYGIAAVMSWTEFVVEAMIFPGMKIYYIFWIIGTILCLFGETLRKLAMITARSNFNHVVQYTKERDHKLITHGIYSVMRHPSYVGWFWWSIGTQIILFNPICIILYAIISWKFFNDRITLEEITLLNFFGRDYYEYQQKVPTGLPLIKGFETNIFQ